MIEEVYKTKTLDEAFNLLEAKSEAMIIAGGTDLVVHMRNGRVSKKVLIDISEVKEIKEIKEEDNLIKIGAGITFNDIINCDKFNRNLYGLKKAAILVGSQEVRSKGTVGGNICNNSPSADLIPPLLALDSKVTIQSKNKERKVYLKDILIDKNKVDLKEDEILTYIEFEKPKPNQVLSFSKLGFRKSLSITKVSASVFVDIERYKFKNIKVTVGVLDDTSTRENNVEKCLIGKDINEKNIREYLVLLEKNISESLEEENGMAFKSRAVKGVVYNAIKESINGVLR